MQTKAVAAGDLTKTVTADVQGEILELKITVNDMVRLKDLTFCCWRLLKVAGCSTDDLCKRSVPRGARSRNGGHSRRSGQVDGVEGVWEDLTDNVNKMARNLTDQVREIAEVVR